MIRKAFCTITVLGIFLLIIFVPHFSLAQEFGLSGVIINDQAVEEASSPWLKQASHMKIRGTNAEIMVELEFDPNSMLIKVIDPIFPLDIIVNDLPCQSNNDPFNILVNDNFCGEETYTPPGIKIKKYKVEILKNEKECIFIDMRLNNKIKWSIFDFLLLPAIYKVLIKMPCQSMFGVKNSIIIYPKIS